MRIEPQTNELLGRWQERRRWRGRSPDFPTLSSSPRSRAARLRRERNSSLSTGDLIHDAVLRLIEADPSRLADRAHIIALSSRMMRRILIDHARQRGRRQAAAPEGHSVQRRRRRTAA